MIDYLKPKVKEIGFFSGLDEDLCEKLVKVGNLVTKKKGEYLVILFLVKLVLKLAPTVKILKLRNSNPVM